MKLLSPPERLGAPEIVFSLPLAFLLLVGVFGSLDALGLGAWPEGDPLAIYVTEPGIRSIALLAFSANILLAWALVSLRFRSWRKRTIALVLLFCCLLGAALPWVELWWGSTFYYGEVRDKQGLPYSTANLGPIGTTLFCMYMATWLRPPLRDPVLRTVACLIVIATAGGAVWWAQMHVLELVEESWRLWRS